MIEQTKNAALRLLSAGLVSAAIGIGGVWFVVSQSLDTLRGQVASIDQRMNGMITAREFDQFLERFSAFERRMDQQFERTRAAYDRASVDGQVVPERTFRLAGDRIVSDAPQMSIEAGALSGPERETIVENLREILASRPAESPAITADDTASYLNLLGFDATAANATTVTVNARP